MKAADQGSTESFTDTHFEWLIERGQPEGQTPTVWLEHTAFHPARHKHWTTEAYAAAMFPTREEAERSIHEFGLTARAVEHGFMFRGSTEPTEDTLADAEADMELLRAHLDEEAGPHSMRIAVETGLRLGERLLALLASSRGVSPEPEQASGSGFALSGESGHATTGAGE